MVALRPLLATALAVAALTAPIATESARGPHDCAPAPGSTGHHHGNPTGSGEDRPAPEGPCEHCAEAPCPASAACGGLTIARDTDRQEGPSPAVIVRGREAPLAAPRSEPAPPPTPPPPSA